MRSLYAAGVEILSAQALTEFDGAVAQFSHVFGGPGASIETDYLLPVTAREPEDSLWRALDCCEGYFKAGTSGEAEAMISGFGGNIDQVNRVTQAAVTSLNHWLGPLRRKTLGRYQRHKRVRRRKELKMLTH